MSAWHDQPNVPPIAKAEKTCEWSDPRLWGRTIFCPNVDRLSQRGRSRLNTKRLDTSIWHQELICCRGLRQSLRRSFRLAHIFCIFQGLGGRIPALETVEDALGLNQVNTPSLSRPIMSRTSRAPNSLLAISIGRTLPRPRTGEVSQARVDPASPSKRSSTAS